MRSVMAGLSGILWLSYLKREPLAKRSTRRFLVRDRLPAFRPRPSRLLRAGRKALWVLHPKPERRAPPTPALLWPAKWCARRLSSASRSPRRLADCGRPESCAGAPDCTTRRGKTHVTESLEVLYPWHPWFGRVVYIHEVIEHGEERIFRCDVGEKLTGRCLNVPAWMFDRAACLRVRWADMPRVNLVALARLKTLFSDVANRASVVGVVIGARHSFENRGDADAAPESSATNRSTQSVPIIGPSTGGVARPVVRCAGESYAPDSADAEQTRSLQSSRPPRRRSGR